MINQEITRTKFDATPQDVLDNKTSDKTAKIELFKKQQKAERKKRAQQLKMTPTHNKAQHFVDKISKAWKKVAPELATEQLYAIKEQLYGRYAFMKGETINLSGCF